MMIIRVVVSIVSFLALGLDSVTETQNSTARRPNGVEVLEDGLRLVPKAKRR
jgi:hypothetical protein